MWYIVEYEKGSYLRRRVTRPNGHERLFKTKKDAENYVKKISYAGMSFTYKVFSNHTCADGDCGICMMHDCPMKSD